MADQIDSLRKVQAVDTELFRLRRERREKPRELERARQEVAAQDAQLKAIEGRLKALQLQQKEKEGDLQTREASVKKLQSQLFQLKTNKEYSAMQHEIDSLKTDNSLLEETILSSFDAVEQATKERHAQQQRMAEVQQQLAQQTVRIEREQAALDEQISVLERRRQELTPAVPPPALAVYERILINREGSALVPLVKDSCGGCHRRQPPQVVNEVYLKAKLVMCENCNRILYVDELEQPLPA